MNSTDTECTTESKIQIRLSAQNGKHVIKDEKINICKSINEKDSVGQASHTNDSYLSKLSSTLKLIREETNSVLTQYISNTSSSVHESEKTKELEPTEGDEDDSDDDTTAKKRIMATSHENLLKKETSRNSSHGENDRSYKQGGQIRKRHVRSASEIKQRKCENGLNKNQRKFRSKSPTPSLEGCYFNNERPRKWCKTLYDRDPSLPDNYAPREFFLAAIERNKHLHKYSFEACIKGSCQVALQVFAVLLLALSYVALANSNCTSLSDTCRHFLLLGIITSCIVGYAFVFLVKTEYCRVLSTKKCNCNVNKNPKKLKWCGSVHQTHEEIESSHSNLIWSWYSTGFKQATIFITFGLALSPVLYKLTDTISTDTIHTMTSLVLLIHLIFHDYGLRSSFVSHPLSLNAGLFAAVCLASRLPTSFDAFVLLFASVEAFVLFPILRRDHIVGLVANLVSVICLCSFTLAVSLYLSSGGIRISAVVALIAIVVLCPKLFVHWQNYKDTIHGPWDEAVPKF